MRRLSVVTLKFLGAMRRVDLSDAPRGPIRFDDYGNPVENIYVRKVERVSSSGPSSPKSS